MMNVDGQCVLNFGASNMHILILTRQKGGKNGVRMIFIPPQYIAEV